MAIRHGEFLPAIPLELSAVANCRFQKQQRRSLNYVSAVKFRIPL